VGQSDSVRHGLCFYDSANFFVIYPLGIDFLCTDFKIKISKLRKASLIEENRGNHKKGGNCNRNTTFGLLLYETRPLWAPLGVNSAQVTHTLDGRISLVVFSAFV